MNEYKSKKILFFKKGKLLSLGDKVVPLIIRLFCRKTGKGQVLLGKLIEYTIVTFIVLSVVFLLK